MNARTRPDAGRVFIPRATARGIAGDGLKLSLKALGYVLGQRRYFLYALLFSWLFFEVVYWMFNTGVFFTVVGSGMLTLLEKLHFAMSPLWTVLSTNGWLSGTLMIAVALLQGISIAVLTYVVPRQKRLNAGIVGGGSIAGLFAVIGLGCPACGTSLLTPIIALFASSSAAAISESITAVALPLAFVIGMIGLYALGLQVAGVRARTSQSKLTAQNASVET